MAGSSVKRLDDPNYMQTAGRALDILALLEDGPSLSLSELSKRTGLSPSVTYRLLYTLGEHGFVKQHPGSKDYSIGDKAVMLGLTGLQEKRIMRAARKLIGEWWLQTGHIITVLCLIDKKAVVVYRINPMPDEADTLYVGASYPLHTGASARILLANMPEEDRREYIESLFIERSAKETLTEDMYRIRERGYDYTEQMMTKGIWGLSVPIFDARGELVAGISTGDHIENNSPDYIQDRLAQLRQLAVKIQARL
ncbi:MAG: IclR family transcriptional regulator [Lawsonibacter sp.]|nr:IclR family transcriptional regulator [Lawsonibacter sp.]